MNAETMHAAFLLLFFPYVVTLGDPNDHCGSNYHLTNGGSDRIVGGRESNTDEFPWFVSIQFYAEFWSMCNKTIDGEVVETDCVKTGWAHRCAGALITSRIILTAAHCGPEQYYERSLSNITGHRLVTGCHAIAGKPNTTESLCQVIHFEADEFIAHPEHKEYIWNGNMKNDIALILLRKEHFRFTSDTTKAVGPVCRSLKQQQVLGRQ
jgi:secreted trypsin-like serine protease